MSYLKPDGLTGRDNDRFTIRLGSHALGPAVGVLGNRRPGVVMRGHDLLWFEQLNGFQGVVRTHREEVTNRQHGDVQPAGAYLRHIAEERRVTSKVNLRAAAKRQQKAARIAAVGP